MPHRFQVLLHGTGFLSRVDEDEPIRGFYVIRRVLADTPEDAARSALAELQREEKYRQLVESTANALGSGAGCNVEVDSVGSLSWWRWHFNRPLSGYIFYSDEEEAD
jgi:hypothetical protein